MAAAREARYRGKQGTNGSLAYDLDYAGRELPHAGKAHKSKGKTKARAIPKVDLRERQYISKIAFLSVAGIMGLALVVLLHYVQLTLLSAEVVELQGQLEELETENTHLKAQYEQMFDVASVKEAAEAAGMSKPSSTQMDRLDLTEGDSAVAYRQKEPNLFQRMLSSLHGGVYAVVEYFD